MRFCMITTFFGEHSFGGDAVYVERLSEALLKRGHEVEVIYNRDAFDLVRRNTVPRSYAPPDGLVTHALTNRLKTLAALQIHQTGTPGFLSQPIEKIVNRKAFDVIHFHNLSLIGGIGLLKLKTSAVKLMTAHEHWLLCPLSLLWKFNREVCQQPQCFRCTLHAKRPPQFWRSTTKINAALHHLHALIFPSRHTLELHRQRGIHAPDMQSLPYFLPDEWLTPNEPSSDNGNRQRPYFLMVGRLVIEKGFQTVISLMRQFPDFDLIIAGDGIYRSHLESLSKDLPNVQFYGLANFSELKQLYAQARALIVPSLFYETFGYVVLEGLSQGTPVLARNLGALPDLITASDGGSVYDTEQELYEKMQQLASQPECHPNRKADHINAIQAYWSESVHLNRYLETIENYKIRSQACFSEKNL